MILKIYEININKFTNRTNKYLMKQNSQIIKKQLEKLRIEQKKKDEVAIHWFRKGLRCHDNEALRYTLQSSKNAKNVFVMPLFILDPHFQNSD